MKLLSDRGIEYAYGRPRPNEKKIAKANPTREETLKEVADYLENYWLESGKVYPPDGWKAFIDSLKRGELGQIKKE